MRTLTRTTLAALLLIMASPSVAENNRAAMHTLEIRGYNLKPGTRDEFHRIFVRDALPMLRRQNIDVVAYGPSQHDADSYFLMRTFASLQERQRSEDAFYGSDEWRHGPREAVLSRIISYTTVVIAVDRQTLGGLRRTD